MSNHTITITNELRDSIVICIRKLKWEIIVDSVQKEMRKEELDQLNTILKELVSEE